MKSIKRIVTLLCFAMIVLTNVFGNTLIVTAKSADSEIDIDSKFREIYGGYFNKKGVLDYVDYSCNIWHSVMGRSDAGGSSWSRSGEIGCSVMSLDFYGEKYGNSNESVEDNDFWIVSLVQNPTLAKNAGFDPTTFVLFIEAGDTNSPKPIYCLFLNSDNLVDCLLDTSYEDDSYSVVYRKEAFKLPKKGLVYFALAIESFRKDARSIPNIPGISWHLCKGNQDPWSFNPYLLDEQEITPGSKKTDPEPSEKENDPVHIPEAHDQSKQKIEYTISAGKSKQTSYTTYLGSDELKNFDQYNRNLAMLCGLLSYASEDDERTGNRIKSLYRNLGIDQKNIMLEDKRKIKDHYGDDLSYSIAHKQVGENMVLFITARGSMTTYEFLNDYATGTVKNNFLGQYTTFNIAYEFQDVIWNGLNSYLDEHPDLESSGHLKVVICGHSLGGAAANLVAARMDLLLKRGEFLSDTLKTEDIACYTFGAIDSVSQYYYETEEGLLPLSGSAKKEKKRCSYDLPITSGFENIHNVYNLQDSFADGSVKTNAANIAGTMFNIPGGNAFTRIGKFGKMYPFSHDYGEGLFDTTNHNMPSYIEAINTHEVEYTEQKIRKWFHGIISCPVDVKIMKGSECVGEIVNDHVTSLTDSEVILYIAGEDKVFFVPDQDHYSIRITATDDGEMEYTIEGLGKDGMRCISDIQLTKGKEMVCELNSKTSVVDTKLYTLDKDGRKSKEIKDDGTEVMVPDFPLVIGIIFLIGFVIYFIYQYLRGSHPTKVAGSK